MNTQNKVSQERLKSLLDYNPDTGVFTRLTTVCGNGAAGRVVGTGTKTTYGRIMVDYCRYPSHRLAWLYVYGVIPEQEIDHIDRNRGNNRISNLRLASRSENQQNVSIRSNNTSGYVGVSFYKPRGNWVASIQVNKRQHTLGYFRTPEEAAEAYATAKRKFHTFNPEIK